MLEAFEARYGDGAALLPQGIVDFQGLRRLAGDRVLGGGLYRVLSDERAEAIEREVSRAFPDFRGLVDCFASDWMGNVFGERRDSRLIVMFEPGTAEVLGMGVPFAQFHESVIVEDADAALAEPAFRQWTAAGNSVPTPDLCAGYRKPLFMGGKDEIDNLELIDMDVYWTMTAPFIAKARPTAAAAASAH